MTLKLNGSTDGSVSIEAPADTSPSGSDITLTLPTTTGSANQFVKNGGTAGELEYSSMVETSTGVGIGTSSPSVKLEVNGGDGLLVKGSSTDSFISNYATENNYIEFKDAGGAAGNINYNHTNNYLSFKVNGSERARFDSSGNVYIGNSSPTLGGRLSLERSGFVQYNRCSGTGTGNIPLILERANDNGVEIEFKRAGHVVGNINVTSTTTNYVESSDYRLKENVVDLDGAITRVKQLAPKRFNFIVDADTTVDGFLAHEAQAVVPEAVTGTHNEVDDDGNAVMQGIDKSKLVPLLTAALQEAIAKIETLETKVAALEAAE